MLLGCVYCNIDQSHTYFIVVINLLLRYACFKSDWQKRKNQCIKSTLYDYYVSYLKF